MPTFKTPKNPNPPDAQGPTPQSPTPQDSDQTRRLTVATLAVGTEVSDGQIVDRNSAWISSRLVEMGFVVVEHRVVPDDRELMALAMRELMARVDLLFLTGGLGPTSDDFTREVLCEVLNETLQFDEIAWTRVQKKIHSRGVSLTADHRRQCYFPRSAEVLLNSVGTADGFCLSKNNLQIYVLPGPPSEIAAIWQEAVIERLHQQVSADDREVLLLWRTMGRGESEVAALVEPIVEKVNSIFASQNLLQSSRKGGAGVPSSDSSLDSSRLLRGREGWRVGYRAHAPYVEVKIWTKYFELDQQYFAEIESVLAPYLVNRDHEDLASDVLDYSRSHRIRIEDYATQGLMAERFVVKMREQETFSMLSSPSGKASAASKDGLERPFQLEIISALTASEVPLEKSFLADCDSLIRPSEGGSDARELQIAEQNQKRDILVLSLGVVADRTKWLVRVGLVSEAMLESVQSSTGTRKQYRELCSCEVSPIYRASVQSERGRKYICERTLQIFLQVLRKSIN